MKIEKLIVVVPLLEVVAHLTMFLVSPPINNSLVQMLPLLLMPLLLVPRPLILPTMLIPPAVMPALLVPHSLLVTRPLLGPLMLLLVPMPLVHRFLVI